MLGRAPRTAATSSSKAEALRHDDRLGGLEEDGLLELDLLFRDVDVLEPLRAAAFARRTGLVRTLVESRRPRRRRRCPDRDSHLRPRSRRDPPARSGTCPSHRERRRLSLSGSGQPSSSSNPSLSSGSVRTTIANVGDSVAVADPPADRASARAAAGGAGLALGQVRSSVEMRKAWSAAVLRGLQVSPWREVLALAELALGEIRVGLTAGQLARSAAVGPLGCAPRPGFRGPCRRAGPSRIRRNRAAPPARASRASR